MTQDTAAAAAASPSTSAPGGQQSTEDFLRALIVEALNDITSLKHLQAIHLVTAYSDTRCEILAEGDFVTRAPRMSPEQEAAAYEKMWTKRRVLGYRPNGEPVTLAKAAAGWGDALDDFLAGGKTYTPEEVRARLASRRKSG